VALIIWSSLGLDGSGRCSQAREDAKDQCLITAARVMLSTRALLLLLLYWGDRLLTKPVREAVPGFLKKYLEINTTNVYSVAFDLADRKVPAEVTAEAIAAGRKMTPEVTIKEHWFPSHVGAATLGPVAWGMR
jgi:hypothetical protein